jgi:hypothetical protein
MALGSPPASAGFLLHLLFDSKGQKMYVSSNRPHSSLSSASELKSNLNIHYPYTAGNKVQIRVG